MIYYYIINITALYDKLLGSDHREGVEGVTCDVKHNYIKLFGLSPLSENIIIHNGLNTTKNGKTNKQRCEFFDKI